MASFRWIIRLLLLFACGETPEPRIDLLALGHIYRWDDTNDHVDPRVASLSLDTFEYVLLLGDLMGRTDEKTQNYTRLDSLFDLRSPRTLWAEGNHDRMTGNIAGHPLQPPDNQRRRLPGLEIWTLNTNLFRYPGSPPDERCAAAGAQLDSLRQWASALPVNTEYLLVLHHQNLLTNAQYAGRPLDKVWNFHHEEFDVRCAPGGRFDAVLLPLFQKIQQTGTQVVFLGGDIGQRTKTFDYHTADGLRYLGTGINNSMDPRYPPRYVTNLHPDSILVLHYFPGKKLLQTHFLPLGGESARYQSIWDKLK